MLALHSFAMSTSRILGALEQKYLKLGCFFNCVSNAFCVTDLPLSFLCLFFLNDPHVFVT